MVAETIKQFGAIDILVNNAGIESHPVLTMELAEESWDRVLNVNLKGSFLCCQAVIPADDEAEQGPDHQHRLDGIHQNRLFRER